MSQTAPPARYKAFLLRLWQESEVDSWRAMIEDPHTGKRYGFTNLSELFRFLNEQTNSPGSEP